MKRVKKFRVWFPVILMLFIIYNFSEASQRQSAALSNSLTNKMIDILAAVPILDFNPAQEDISLQILHMLVRKSGHLTEYAVLALAVAFALYKYQVSGSRLITWCMAFGFVYACTDEIHQLFIPGRSGRFTDVMIDSLGMFLGVLFFYSLIFISHKAKSAASKKIAVKQSAWIK